MPPLRGAGVACLARAPSLGAAMPALRNAFTSARTRLVSDPLDAPGPSGPCGRSCRTKPRLTTRLEDVAGVGDG